MHDVLILLLRSLVMHFPVLDCDQFNPSASPPNSIQDRNPYGPGWHGYRDISPHHHHAVDLDLYTCEHLVILPRSYYEHG